MQLYDGNIPPKLAGVLQTFGTLTEETDRSEILIDYASQFKGVPEHVAKRPYSQEQRVLFCESEAYVWAIEQPGQTLKFYFAVENPSGISAKALAVILDKTLSGAKPELVVNVSPDIVYKIFRKDIAMGKGMGLTSMVQTVQQLARRYIAQLHNN
jgi:sulfur transfer protein SufE